MVRFDSIRFVRSFVRSAHRVCVSSSSFSMGNCYMVLSVRRVKETPRAGAFTIADQFALPSTLGMWQGAPLASTAPYEMAHEDAYMAMYFSKTCACMCVCVFIVSHLLLPELSPSYSFVYPTGQSSQHPALSSTPCAVCRVPCAMIRPSTGRSISQRAILCQTSR